MNEFEIIDKYFKKLANTKESLDLKDDCAVFKSLDNIIVNVDSIISGKHFFSDDEPRSIANKLLGVNLSDIAAMGAKPKYWTLAITFPVKEKINYFKDSWLQEFSDEILRIQEKYNFHLIGGDTTFSDDDFVLSANLFGLVPSNYTPLYKTACKEGDILCVSNFIGDSYWGLQILLHPLKFSFLSPEEKLYLINKYKYVDPQIHLGYSLLGYASACTDVSDGLWVDLEKMCKVSGKKGILNLDSLKFSSPVEKILSYNSQIVSSITGGDDYQLIFSISIDNLERFKSTYPNFYIQEIGRVLSADSSEDYLVVFHNNSRLLPPKSKGFIHNITN